MHVCYFVCFFWAWKIMQCLESRATKAEDDTVPISLFNENRCIPKPNKQQLHCLLYFTVVNIGSF